jgi:hypothetical protein
MQDLMETAFRSGHSLRMVGDRVSGRGVPAHVASGSGPAQLDRSVTGD